VTVQLYKKKDTKTAETPKDTKVGDKPDTAGWIKAGTLSGKIVGAGKNTSTLTLQIDTAAMTKGGYHSPSNAKTNKVTIPDTKVTQVMILSKDIPDTDPQPEKKKKKCPGRNSALARYFKFHTVADLEAESKRLRLQLRFADDFAPLFRPVSIGPLRA